MKFALALILSLVPGLAAANFAGCTKAETATIQQAVQEAKGLAVFAATAVKDDEIFDRWFGKYSPAAGEVVRANLKAIAKAIRSGSVTGQCEGRGVGTCAGSAYAWVFPDEPYVIHFCERFFNMPVMSSLRPGSQFSNNGTRAGTIVHELSHFENVARTQDNCYARDECEGHAAEDPASALNNADSYQYYAEDIVHFADRQVQASQEN